MCRGKPSDTFFGYFRGETEAALHSFVTGRVEVVKGAVVCVSICGYYTLAAVKVALECKTVLVRVQLKYFKVRSQAVKDYH